MVKFMLFFHTNQDEVSKINKLKYHKINHNINSFFNKIKYYN